MSHDSTEIILTFLIFINVVLFNIIVETIILFSGVFNEYNVQNNIYLKYYSFDSHIR